MQQFSTTLSWRTSTFLLQVVKLLLVRLFRRKLEDEKWVSLVIEHQISAHKHMLTHAHTKLIFHIPWHTILSSAWCSDFKKFHFQTSYLLIWVFNLNFVWTNVKYMEKILVKNVRFISKTCMFSQYHGWRNRFSISSIPRNRAQSTVCFTYGTILSLCVYQTLKLWCRKATTQL